MRKILVTGAVLALLSLVVPATALATIHPIVANNCAATIAESRTEPADPPGQTPASEDPATFDRSDLRALQASGVLTITDSGPEFDLTRPNVKWSAPFEPDRDFPAFAHCPNPEQPPE